MLEKELKGALREVRLICDEYTASGYYEGWRISWAIANHFLAV